MFTTPKNTTAIQSFPPKAKYYLFTLAWGVVYVVLFGQLKGSFHLKPNLTCLLQLVVLEFEQ